MSVNTLLTCTSGTANSPGSLLVRPEETFRDKGQKLRISTQSLNEMVLDLDADALAGSDGAERTMKKPTVSLVFFGEIEQELKDTLLSSMERFFAQLEGELPIIPVIVPRYSPLPERIPAKDQDQVFLPVLRETEGNIVLGITDTGFYDTFVNRYIFSTIAFSGGALLSTYRFRRETGNRALCLERLGKQVIKTLAMACDVGSCADPKCVVSYHRWVEDLDRNKCVCERCREELVHEIKYYLNDSGSSPGTPPVVGR